MTSCGLSGGGTATRSPVGSYIILFENIGGDATTGHVGIRLGELLEPRILREFDDRVRSAGLIEPGQ